MPLVAVRFSRLDSLPALPHLLSTDHYSLSTRFLAGRPGFEPGQSAPKALDLPLVDRPVKQLTDHANICSQYSPRVSVAVTSAACPDALMRRAAACASSPEANTPYNVAPEPDSEA